MLAGVLRRDARAPIDASPAASAVARGGGGLSWIYIGVALTVVALVASLIWTMQVLAAVEFAPPARRA